MADIALADAFRENGRVWLAAERNQWDRETESSALAAQSVVLPYEPLRLAAAGWGVAVVRPEDDFMIRRSWLGPAADGAPALTWAVAEGIGLRPPRREWLRYLGGPLALPHVGFSAALRQDEVPDEFFRDRVVVVGARPMVGGFVERRDEFRNPLGRFAFGRVFMPAVEVHATQMVNLIRGDGLRRPSPVAEAVAMFLLTVAAALGFGRMRPLPILGGLLLAEGLLLGAVAWGMSEDLWFPWMVMGLVQLPGAAIASIAHHSIPAWIQRRKLEAEKRVSDEHIREQAALIDAASDAIVVQDLEGAIRFVNPVAAVWYGGAPGAAFRLGGLEENARKTVLAKGAWVGEGDQTAADGRVIRVQARWTLLRDMEGRPKSILAIQTDLTEQRRVEAQFLRMQRMETVGALAGGMAHDLNNALAPVLLGVQLLRQKEADAERRQLLDLMEANANRGADLVRQVLLFARGRGGIRETLRPGAVLQDLAAVLKPTMPREIEVQTMVAGDAWSVSADPTQLNQVLLNLALNARDAMMLSGRGELTLAVDNVVLGAGDTKGLPGSREGEFVLFLVSDTGPGMTPEVMARIFEPFFTTKPTGSGTGLGLASVARIVRSHEGFVNVRSSPGEGAVFEVYWPRVPQEAGAGPSGEPSPSGGVPAIALVISRELSLAGMVSEALRESGGRVVVASQPGDVIPMVEVHRSRLRWIIVDRDSLGDAQRQLKRAGLAPGSCRLVLLGGQADGESGAVQLPRPFEREQLIQAIRG